MWIKSTFADKGIKVWCSSLLSQVVLISSIKRTRAVFFNSILGVIITEYTAAAAEYTTGREGQRKSQKLRRERTRNY